MSTKKSIQKFVGVVVLLALVFGAVAVNFTRSASTSVAPAMMGMEGGVAAAGPDIPGSDLPETAVIPLAGHSDVDLRRLPQTGIANKKLMPEMLGPRDDSLGVDAGPDAVLQSDYSIEAMPVPTTHFAGLDLQSWGAGWPPDTHGAVGPNHYIQAVNTSMAIYNKTGTRLAAFTLNNFMSGSATGSACDSYNQGDPIVLYDDYSGRWIITDFAWKSTRGPFYECIAVSKTADPVTGGWWFYEFQVDKSSMGDYPKLGVWSDGIYMGASMFRALRTYSGARVWAFNRDDMISGASLRYVTFFLGTSYFSVFPSTSAPGGGVPPAGTPNYFFSDYGLTNGVRMWKFTVNWATPTASTFTGPTTVPVASFTKPANASVPQPGTTQKLDTLGDRLMSNFEYRNLNGTQSLWLTRTVVSGTSTGIRWMELRDMSTTPTVYQQGTFAPDSNYRFMPSLSVDKYGNMAVGYSVSSTSVYPSIRYAGRLATDPLGQLSQGEASIIAGTGSQTSYSRWGDYSSMTIDPADGCTFWYTNEYYTTTGTNWQTRIATFKFPGCTP